MFVTLDAGIGSASTAVEKVREGISAFADGQFETAGKAFAEADVADPENPTITFDRACALAAAGDVDKARELFQESALARDASLAAESQYNLGCLDAQQGRAALGDDPVAAAPEQRQQGLSLLLSAVGHYRDCLQIDAEHANARYNLELIRLFIKNIRAEWEQRDREKAREEMNLLEFLAMIEQRQTGLRTTVRELIDEPDSPQRRQTAGETADAQTELREEIEPLKAKIAEQFQAAAKAQTGNSPAGQQPPTDEKAKQAQQLLTQLADEVGSLMTDASSSITGSEFNTAADKQRDVLDRLNQIFMAVAPFSNVLQRATQQQEQLTSTSEAATGADQPQEDDTASDDSEKAKANDEKGKTASADQGGPDADYPELEWQQSQVTDWSRMLKLKAQAELPQVESQLQAAHGQNQQPKEDSSQEDEQTANAQSPQGDPTAQLEGLQASLKKAIELGPQVESHSTSAAESLEESDMATALPDQQEALRLLREIAEPLAKQNQQQDNQQQDNKNNEQQNKQQQNQQQSQQQQNQQQQKREQQQGQSPQQQAMSVLRRAREREREHRELQKQVQEMAGGRVQVDKDW